LPPLPLQWCVRQPIDSRGLARAELQAYHYPQTGDGEETDRPTRIFDGVIDPLRPLADAFFLRSAPMCEREQIERALPEHLQLENIQKFPPEQQNGHYFTRFTRGIEIEELPTNCSRADGERAHGSGWAALRAILIIGEPEQPVAELRM
jgi:hypothetical protein